MRHSVASRSRDQVLVRREGVVGQRLPVGEHGARAGRARRTAISSIEPLRVGRLGGEDRGQRGRAACSRSAQAGEQQRVGRAGRAGQREALAGGDVGEVHEGDGSRCHARHPAIRRGDRACASRDSRMAPAMRRCRRTLTSARLLRAGALRRQRQRAPARRRPKQYAQLAGQPLVAHTLAALARGAALRRHVLVVLAPDDAAFERGVPGLPGRRAGVAALRRRDARRHACANGLHALRRARRRRRRLGAGARRGALPGARRSGSTA